MEGARPATDADVARLAELGRAMLAELVGSRGGDVFTNREARLEPLEASFSADIAADDRTVWVGTIDDVVIGFAAGETEELRDGRTLGRVGDLYVEPGARGIGVGECVMEGLLTWFREHGCFAVDALALPGDRETKNFFEESGFTARLLVMHHRLED